MTTICPKTGEFMYTKKEASKKVRHMKNRVVRYCIHCNFYHIVRPKEKEDDEQSGEN